MAAGIFNPENDFWRLIEKLVDLFLLSVFWLVCSLPVFTLGPATAALYRTVARCIRGSERKSWSLFFRTFRENFKVGALFHPRGGGCRCGFVRSLYPALSDCIAQPRRLHPVYGLLCVSFVAAGPAVLPLPRPLPV